MGRLLHLPLLEPILVESESDVQAEDILLDKSGSRILHPLATDIQLRTVVVGIHDRNTETGTYRKLLRAIHAVHLIIWCSKAYTGTVSHTLEESTAALTIAVP